MMKNVLSGTLTVLFLTVIGSPGFSRTFESVVLNPGANGTTEATFVSPITCDIGSGNFSLVGLSRELQGELQMDFNLFAKSLEGTPVTITGSISEETDCFYSMDVRKIEISIEE